MYKILSKRQLRETIVMMEIYAPAVARKAQAGQFIILRVNDEAERIPLTIAGFNKDRGSVKIIFQTVGATTTLLAQKNEGEYISDFAGPLGQPTKTEGLKKVILVGGGVGCAIALPIAEKLHSQGCETTAIVGFRSSDFVILRDEFSSCCDKVIITTDDGSEGVKGLVTEPLGELLSKTSDYDEIVAIGPLIMMKFVVSVAREFGVPCTVSMNPIMIDGTGMCGGCRLTVGGKTKFACVDGPDFDGYLVDFDEAIERSSIYRDFEEAKKEETCNLLRGENNG